MSRRISLIALITVVLTVAACQKSTPEAAPAAVSTLRSVSAEPDRRAPSIEACALLSRTDVDTIFGSLKNAPKSDKGLRGEKECRYQNVEGQWLKLSLYSADRWELEKGIVSEQHPASISGLGDEAFAVKQGSDSVVYVRKGGGILEVSCSCGMQKAQDLARNAAGKI